MLWPRIVSVQAFTGNVVVWWAFMFVYLQEFLDIPRHRNVNSACAVVPMQFDAAIKIARPILCKFIFFFMHLIK